MRLVLMGLKTSLYLVWMMVYMSLSPIVQGTDGYNTISLDAFFRDHAYKMTKYPRTGILYNVSLPSNFSGVEVSIVRLRTASFWTRGANFSSFNIPPRIIPMPYIKRIAIVYQNLGNLSSHYYNVPNFTLVSPIVGFIMYNAMNSRVRDNDILQLIIKGDPILIHFDHILGPKDSNVTLKCVRFGYDGSFELSNMTMPNACTARNQGHFGVVVQFPLKRRKERIWKWWVVGFGVGVGGLILVTLVGLLMYKLFRRKRMRSMVRQSEKSEALETTWVGMSKMPSATRIRTQPMLENDYLL